MAAEDRVERVVTLYVDRHLKPNGKPGYAETQEGLLRNHVVPRWGQRRIGDVTKREVVALIDGLTDAGMTTGANRVFAATRALFNFALRRELITTTPFLGLKPPLAETSRDRVLTDVEVRLVWRAADAIGFQFGPAAQLLLLTAQRRDEVIRMVRAEVDGDLWTLPAERTKNSLEHLVPLAPPVPLDPRRCTADCSRNWLRVHPNRHRADVGLHLHEGAPGQGYAGDCPRRRGRCRPRS